MSLSIRPARETDAPAIWAILEPVFRDGETYAQSRDISRDAALAYWTGGGKRVWVAEDGSAGEGNASVLGTFFVVANQKGGGAHVANAAFATAPAARGRGVARRMLAHALDDARASGFAAMQFNYVLASNAPAIRLWEEAGFETVGRVPEAFDHPRQGRVDALVMWRRL